MSAILPRPQCVNVSVYPWSDVMYQYPKQCLHSMDFKPHIDGLMQKWRNSIANTLGFHLIYIKTLHHYVVSCFHESSIYIYIFMCYIIIQQ